jgi:hypothetical protein
MQNFVDGSTPTIGATWLNKLDVLLVTVFDEATTPEEALTALGAATVGLEVFQSADIATALAALDGTATGIAVFQAANAAAARTAIGAGATGTSLITAATAAAALGTLEATATGIAVLQAANAAAARTAIGVTSPYDFVVAASDESTPIVAAVGNVTFRAPRAFTLSSVKASLRTASDTGPVTIDVTMGGVSIFSTVITIEVNETTSLDAATQPVLSTTAITADALMSVNITADGNNAAGLKLYFIGTLP